MEEIRSLWGILGKMRDFWEVLRIPFVVYSEERGEASTQMREKLGKSRSSR